MLILISGIAILDEGGAILDAGIVVPDTGIRIPNLRRQMQLDAKSYSVFKKKPSEFRPNSEG
jgi:hypothetical protein